MQKTNLSALQSEISYKTSRSGGKGGQNVNKVSTKVELNFDITNSLVLDEEQKAVLLAKLKNRIHSEGILQIIAQAERTQLKNKKAALLKFYTLLEEAFYVQKKRKPTKIPRSVIEKRLKDKRKKGETKKFRRGDE